MYDPGLRDEVFAFVKKIEDAKKEVNEATRGLKEQVALLLSRVSEIERTHKEQDEILLDRLTGVLCEIGETANREELVKIMSALYTGTELPPKWIAATFGLRDTDAMKKILGKVVVKCANCGRDMKIPVNRQPIDKQTSWCYKCCGVNKAEERRAKNKIRLEREEEIKKARQEELRQYQEKVAYLRSLPYDEYLKTSWWQSLRSNAMKKAHGRCQTCNRKDIPLHVHHRTYERRGDEPLSDLIVLCEDCHGKIHEVKK